MDREVAELVLGRRLDPARLRAAILHGYRRLVVAEETYPALAPGIGGKVTGVLLDGVDRQDLARLQFFESEEFAPASCQVELVAGGCVSAQTFFASEALRYSDQAWNYTHWLASEKQQYLAQTAAWMSEFGHRGGSELEAVWSESRTAAGGHRRQGSGGSRHD